MIGLVNGCGVEADNVYEPCPDAFPPLLRLEIARIYINNLICDVNCVLHRRYESVWREGMELSNLHIVVRRNAE